MEVLSKVLRAWRSMRAFPSVGKVLYFGLGVHFHGLTHMQKFIATFMVLYKGVSNASRLNKKAISTKQLKIIPPLT